MSVAALEKRKEDKSGNGSNTLEIKKLSNEIEMIIKIGSKRKQN